MGARVSATTGPVVCQGVSREQRCGRLIQAAQPGHEHEPASHGRWPGPVVCQECRRVYRLPLSGHEYDPPSHGICGRCLGPYRAAAGLKVDPTRRCGACGDPLTVEMFPWPAMFRRAKFCNNACYQLSRRECFIVRVEADHVVMSVPSSSGPVETLISHGDLPLAYEGAWTVNDKGYIANGTRTLHAAVTGTAHSIARGYHVDHINRNKLDNRRENLRVVVIATNARNHNLARHNTSGVTGVRWTGERWLAYIHRNGNNQYLGRFHSFDEAVTARKRAERLYWPEVSA